METEEKAENVSVGLHFCDNCHNILTPLRANEQSLEFVCRNCRKCQKDFSSFKDHEKLVYSKTNSSDLKVEAVDHQQLMEPMNKRVKVVCSDCDYDEAVIEVKPERSQSNIEIYLLCARVDPFVCSNYWKLGDDQPIPPSSS